MRTLRACAWMVLALSTHSAEGAWAQSDAEAAFRDARTYTVRIRTQINTPFLGDVRGSFEGAGFLVDARRRWIATNAHVVGQSPSEVQVAFAGEAFQPARKIYVDSFADVAILAVDSLAPGRRAAVLTCGEATAVGEPVGAFGHPRGMPFTGTRGIVSGHTDQFGPDLIQIDATVDHGNSGGPVIALRDRRVVGIATAGAGGDKADRLNFATPIEDVCRILSLLRRDIVPSPPFMTFALLVDEDDRHTMRVGCSHDTTRWPFAPGDRIVAVDDGRELHTLSDLVGVLRGRAGHVPITVEREGLRATVIAQPTSRPTITERRGISIDGALIAPFPFEDQASMNDPPALLVHSVAPASAAEALGLQSGDMLHSLDGRRFADLDSLIAYAQRRPRGAPLRIVLRRFSPDAYRVLDLHERDLPDEDVTLVGPDPRWMAARR